MSKLFGKIANLFSSRTLAGIDKAGNQYFTRNEVIDGIIKEKRWVIFKGEVDSTSIPVEWICWLNGQRKKAPTPEEMMELQARRERVRMNVALLKEKEKEEKKAGQHIPRQGKVEGPNLRSFIQQFPAASTKGQQQEDAFDAAEMRNAEETRKEKTIPPKVEQQPESSEPTGSGPSFRPGTWQPPT